MSGISAYAPLICAAATALSFIGFWKRPERADAIVLAALTLLLLTGASNAQTLFSGFSNPGVITIAMLFVVAAGLRESGAMHVLGTLLLREPKSVRMAQLTVTLPVATLSAFIANTPLVALYMPLVQDWAARHQMPASRFLMPLSFAAIVGGSLTLIGSSVNLVANSVLIAWSPDEPGFGFFETALVGLPVAIAALAYMHFMQGRLPVRQSLVERTRDVRRYSLELQVSKDSPVTNKSVSAAGLRNLNSVFLTEILRDGELIAPVEPSTLIRAGDRLVFVGDPERISDLLRIPGLDLRTDRLFEVRGSQRQRHLYEAVISDRSPKLGQSVRDAGFRSHYDAAIIAISRDGRELKGRLGNVVLSPGDVLLLDAGGDFGRRWSGSADFLMLHPLGDTTIPVIGRPRLAIGIVLAMILGNLLGAWDMLTGSLLAAAGMLGGRCLSFDTARKSLDISLLAVIAGAIGLGKALEASGVLRAVTEPVVLLTQGDDHLFVAAVFVISAVVTTLISNAAAVALVLPLAISAAASSSIGIHGAAMTVLIGASASFASPMAYQTNLMVMGPGGYTPADFFRFGMPLVLISGCLTTFLIPLFY